MWKHPCVSVAIVFISHSIVIMVVFRRKCAVLYTFCCEDLPFSIPYVYENVFLFGFYLLLHMFFKFYFALKKPGVWARIKKKQNIYKSIQLLIGYCVMFIHIHYNTLTLFTTDCKLLGLINYHCIFINSSCFHHTFLLISIDFMTPYLSLITKASVLLPSCESTFYSWFECQLNWSESFQNINIFVLHWHIQFCLLT